MIINNRFGVNYERKTYIIVVRFVIIPVSLLFVCLFGFITVGVLGIIIYKNKNIIEIQWQ